jgi:hypothetical protein
LFLYFMFFISPAILRFVDDINIKLGLFEATRVSEQSKRDNVVD